MKTSTDPRVDAYLDQAADFAKPVLIHVRRLVHRACPGAEETIKWGMPSFTYDGKILCGMAAFKEHCAFGFWHQGMAQAIGAAGAKAEQAMGSLGRIATRADLPSDAAMVGYIRQAAKLIAAGGPARPKPKPRKPLRVPVDFAAALKKNRAAAEAFQGFAPGQRREYVEWITEARRDETRQTRLSTAIGWIAEGKKRNWQYANG
ncbi:MAG: hypothetical protein JWM88_3415 [Verrucomicrobia bacterium]|nr:hypothetical protein [Verrucomicrobiota bacterium]